MEALKNISWEIFPKPDASLGISTLLVVEKITFGKSSEGKCGILHVDR